MSSTRIATIPLKQLRGSPYNPGTRIENVEKIKASIMEHGQQVPITVIEFPNNTFGIADGHRRVQSMLQLGVESIKAIVHTPNASEDAQALLNKLFVELNQGTKPFNGRDKLNVALQGGPVFDNNIRSAKTQLELLFNTPEEREMLVNKEITTTVLSLAKKMARGFLAESGIGEDTPTFRNRVRSNILYLLRNDVQQSVVAYMRMGYDMDLLKKAVDANRPPPRVSSPRLIEGWQKVAKSEK